MPSPKAPLAPSPPSPASPPAARRSKRQSRLRPAQGYRPGSIPDPSSGILALLVTVAGSSSAAASPVPPDFLCPRLYQALSPSDASSWYFVPCDDLEYSSSPSKRNTPSDTYSARHLRSRKRLSYYNVEIADKYEQSSDGRWRKADSWALYGSSSCAVSQCMDTTTATGVSVKEDQVSTATSTSTSTMPTLPNGWGPTKEDGMTPVILGLSLLLALLLIIVMMGIVLWRRKRRKLKGKDRDAEKTTDVPDQELSEEHKRAMSQQRMWSRASARWMNNVRQAARRRRKRVATGLVKGSDVSLLDQPSFAGCSSSVSLAHTSTTQGDASSSWRRSSRSRSRGEMRSLSRSRSSSIRLHDPEGPSRPLSHPPAYIPRPSCDRTTEHLHPSDSTTPSSSTPKASFAFAAQSSTPVPTPPSSPIPYDSIHSAHVATDDKVVLARMAELASAPPPTAASWPTAPSAGSTEIRPSVPELEEEFEVLPSELDSRLYGDRADRRASSSRTAHDRFREGEDPQPADSGLHQDCMDGEVPTYAEDALRHRTLALPAPPQKVPLNGPSFYEYPSEFEDDVANVGPSLGPSSPPFEAPSAPPCEEEDPRMMFPSAPPLEYAEGSSPSSEACIPSAPALESPTGLAPALPFPAPALNPRPCPGDHGPPRPDGDVPVAVAEPCPPRYLP